MDRALTEGDELKCPHCRRWHTVYRPLRDNTPRRQLQCSTCGGREFKMGTGDKGIVICLKNHAVGTADTLSVVRSDP